MQDRYMQRYNFIKYRKICKLFERRYYRCTEGERITLKVSQSENYQRNCSKTNVSIFIYNDKIINTTSITKNEQNKSYTKDANEEIECTNKVRYIILRKIMHSLFKICKKKNDETNKNKKYK